MSSPPLHKRQAPPHKRNAPLLTFWRRFWFGLMFVKIFQADFWLAYQIFSKRRTLLLQLRLKQSSRLNLQWNDKLRFYLVMFSLLRHIIPAIVHILTQSVYLVFGPKSGFKNMWLARARFGFVLSGRVRASQWGPLTTLPWNESYLDTHTKCYLALCYVHSPLWISTCISVLTWLFYWKYLSV